MLKVRCFISLPSQCYDGTVITTETRAKTV